MDVTEQAPLLGRTERRPAAELERASDVVQERGGERGGRCAGADGAAPSRGRASRRRPCARAALRRSRGDRPRPRPEAPGMRSRTPSSPRMRRRPRASPAWAISPARKSRKPSSSSASRRIVGVSSAGSLVRRGLDRAHLHLQPAAEPLHAAEHAHGVALGEATVEQLDVVPDARLDPAARVDELEGEIGRAVLRPAGAPCGRRRTRPRRSGPRRARRCWSRRQSRRARYARAVADVSPFRAIRYAHPSPARDGAALRRADAGSARRLPCARPPQRRPPDAERLRGRGRAAVSGVARRGRPRPGRRACGLGRRAGLRRARRDRATPRRPRRLAPGRAVRDRRPCCRTSGRTPARRRAACGSSAPRGRSSSRSSCSTTASRPWPFPSASRTSSPGEHAALARAGRRRRRGVRRTASS